MQPAAYFDTDAYNHALDKLETMARTFDPAAPDDLRTRLVEVLGDLGVWPADCAEDAKPRLVA